jgi:hypothetical protein
MNLDDAIKRAHAKEIHPSNALVSWNAQQLDLYRVPDDGNDVNWDMLELNVIARVIYMDGGDFPVPMPLNDDTMPVAESISTHDDVAGVALYQCDADGNNAPTPSCVWHNGALIA